MGAKCLIAEPGTERSHPQTRMFEDPEKQEPVGWRGHAGLSDWLVTWHSLLL